MTMDRRQIDVCTQLSPIIPYEILNHTCRYAARLYGEIVRLAAQSGGDSLSLPDRVTMARAVDCSLHSLTAAYSALEALGYVVVHNRNTGGPTRRKYATVKTVDRVLVDTVTVHQATVELPPQQETFPGFPAHLRARKSVAVNKDRNGNTLKNIDDRTLWELSGGASFEDIYLAVCEVESYRPKDNKPIENIFNVFLARFQFDRQGRGSLKTDRARKKKYVESKDAPTATTADPHRAHAEKIGASIFPDTYHDAKCVDRFCEVLNSRGAVERGETPKSIREKWLGSSGAIVAHRDEPDQKLVLADRWELVKLEPGYWTTRPVVYEIPLAKRSTDQTPGAPARDVRDGLKSILSGLAVSAS